MVSRHFKQSHKPGVNGSARAARGQARNSHLLTFIEPLEQRQLLSVAAPVTLAPSAASAPAIHRAETVAVVGSLGGVVTTSNGTPVPNARVYAVPVPLNTALVVAVSTNSSGQYTIPSLPVGTWTIHAAAPGYREGTTASFTVSQGANTAPTLQLAIAGIVTGTVTDANGFPLANASVAIVPSGASSAIATLTTNSSGQYTFQSVPLGSYLIRGSESGYVGATSAAFTVNGGSNTAPTLKLTKIVYASLTGVITDPNGNPIANARVYAVPIAPTLGSAVAVTTNAIGQYTIPSLPIGTFSIYAAAPGYREAQRLPLPSATAPTPLRHFNSRLQASLPGR